MRSTLALALILACNGDKGGGPTDLTFATYNVGLAYGFVPYSPERAPEVHAALATLEADAVCLQEVWTEEDATAIASATADNLPYSYVERTEEEGVSDEPACTEEETAPLLACLEENCADTDSLAGCALTFCSEEFYSLSKDCANCATANIGLNDAAAILEVCQSGSGTLTWGGHNGLMLLSATEPAATAMEKLDSWLVQRVGLYAEIEGVAVVCTHLAADLSAPDYGGTTYASYEEENAAQLTAMMDWANELADGGPVVLLGDLNTGPELTGGISAELADNWAMVAAEGWVDANVASSAPFCTWCSSNMLTGDVLDKAIDHILVRGATTSDAERIYDETLTITTDDGEVEMPLSDHYGWTATVTVE